MEILKLRKLKPVNVTYYLFEVLLYGFVGEAFLLLALFPGDFFGELCVRENSRNSSFKFALFSFCVMEAICLSSWQALIA